MQGSLTAAGPDGVRAANEVIQDGSQRPPRVSRRPLAGQIWSCEKWLIRLI